LPPVLERGYYGELNMAIDTTKTVREFVLELPSSTNVFEQHGIDYCCGGQKPLAEACATAGIKLDNLTPILERLQSEQQTRTTPAKTWVTEPLHDLIEHIKSTHHVYVREQAPNIEALLDKVTAKHGENHPELNRVRDKFGALAEELAMHLMKEELILFPYIARSEESSLQHEPAPPSCFGSVENPIRMMMSEHDNAGEALREIRRSTTDYKLPDDACTSFCALYKLLQEFEADLHQHIHKENNILFPRAMQVCKAAA
jgi:regulator of cell morphogenesis and NO signaling